MSLVHSVTIYNKLWMQTNDRQTNTPPESVIVVQLVNRPHHRLMYRDRASAHTAINVSQDDDAYPAHHSKSEVAPADLWGLPRRKCFYAPVSVHV